jgi:acyl-CoA hydrolase
MHCLIGPNIFSWGLLCRGYLAGGSTQGLCRLHHHFLKRNSSVVSPGVLAPDAVLIHVSPPDTYGFCSLGTSVEVSLAAFKGGSGVVTNSAHVHEIVTEYGVANLYGKSLRQGAAALIEITQPDHREMLEKAAFDRIGRSGIGFC